MQTIVLKEGTPSEKILDGLRKGLYELKDPF